MQGGGDVFFFIDKQKYIVFVYEEDITKGQKVGKEQKCSSVKKKQTLNY